MNTLSGRLVAISALMLCVVTPGWGTTYKKVTKDGPVYSDRPSPGAEIVELSKAQTYEAPPAPATPAGTSAKPADTAVQYTLELWKPANDEVFVNTSNTVPVRLRLDPALQTGHSIYIYLDGKRVDGLPTGGDSFELSEVPRGTHTVNAVVADDHGKPLARSQAVTFNLRQVSVLTRPRQANPPPPPRR